MVLPEAGTSMSATGPATPGCAAEAGTFAQARLVDAPIWIPTVETLPSGMREVSSTCAPAEGRLILAKCAVQCMHRRVAAAFELCMLPGPWKWSPAAAAFA